MKNRLIYLLPILIGFTLLGLTSHAPDEGVVGEVRFSILGPAKFRQLYGQGWDLLAGQSVNGTDKLCTAGGFCTALPDARGVFIRGVNGARDANSGDPEGATRQVGSYQADVFKAHNHALNHEIFVATPWDGLGWGTVRGDHPLYNRGRPAGDNNPLWLATQVVGDTNETRPRNIALYVYVKVN
jgi:hypothetical protein